MATSAEASPPVEGSFQTAPADAQIRDVHVGRRESSVVGVSHPRCKLTSLTRVPVPATEPCQSEPNLPCVGCSDLLVVKDSLEAGFGG